MHKTVRSVWSATVRCHNLSARRMLPFKHQLSTSQAFTRDLPASSKCFILQNPPTGALDLGITASATFALTEQPLPDLKEGATLVETVYLSNDPAQRRWIQGDLAKDNLYVNPVKAGEIMRSGGIGRVVKTTGNGSSLREGDLVICAPGWTEYAALPTKSLRRIKDIEGVSPSAHLGALGVSGLTAYYGLVEVLKLQPRESIVVSGAAGAVGNVVVQYAKKVLRASKVIAIAGSTEKGELLLTLGADIALNYKDPDFARKLVIATEGQVATYFDNVGGEILDQMLPRMKAHGRIAVCGAISIYNNPKATQFQNWFDVVGARLTIQGFLLRDYMTKVKEGTEALTQAVVDGKLVLTGLEDVHDVSFEQIPNVWGKLFAGQNTGKLITRIAK